MAAITQTPAIPSIGTLHSMDPAIQSLISDIRHTINTASSIHGIDETELTRLRPGLEERWNVLVERGVLITQGPDREIRPYFVHLQGIVEHVLARHLNKTITTLDGVIHTPLPATPLCMKGEISPHLVAPSVEEDPARLSTVQARATIVRDFLHQGGTLHVVYRAGGLEKREENQREIYQSALADYPEHLINCRLNTDEFPSDLVGAYYLFTTASGKQYAFAIKIAQANKPEEDADCGLWFGSVEQNDIHDRISNVVDRLSPFAPTSLPQIKS